MSTVLVYLKSFFGNHVFEASSSSWGFRLGINGIDTPKKLYGRFVDDKKGARRIFENISESDFSRLFQDLKTKFKGTKVESKIHQPPRGLIPKVISLVPPQENKQPPSVLPPQPKRDTHLPQKKRQKLSLRPAQEKEKRPVVLPPQEKKLQPLGEKRFEKPVFSPVPPPQKKKKRRVVMPPKKRERKVKKLSVNERIPPFNPPPLSNLPSFFTSGPGSSNEGGKGGSSKGPGEWDKEGELQETFSLSQKNFAKMRQRIRTDPFETIVKNVVLFFFVNKEENKGYLAEDVQEWVSDIMKKDVLVSTIRYSFRMVKQYGFLDHFRKGRNFLYRIAVYQSGRRKGKVTDEAMSLIQQYLGVDEEGDPLFADELNEDLGGHQLSNEIGSFAVPDEIFPTGLSNTANFFYTHREINKGYTRQEVFEWMSAVIDRKTKLESVKWSLRKMQKLSKEDGFLHVANVKGNRCRQNEYKLETYEDGDGDGERRRGKVTAKALGNLIKFMKQSRPVNKPVVRRKQCLEIDMLVKPEQVYMSENANVANFFKTFSGRKMELGFTEEVVVVWVRKYCQPGIQKKTVKECLTRMVRRRKGEGEREEEEEEGILQLLPSGRYSLKKDENGYPSSEAVKNLEEFMKREVDRFSKKRKRRLEGPKRTCSSTMFMKDPDLFFPKKKKRKLKKHDLDRDRDVHNQPSAAGETMTTVAVRPGLSGHGQGASADKTVVRPGRGSTGRGSAKREASKKKEKGKIMESKRVSAKKSPIMRKIDSKKD